MTETPSKIAANLIKQRKALEPLRDQLQAAVDAAAERVQKFTEELSESISDDQWDYFLEDAIDDWELGWLNGSAQRVSIENVNSKDITFYDEGEYYILDFATLDNLDSTLRITGAQWRAEYLSERENEEREAVNREGQEREELLAEIEAIDPSAAALLRDNGWIKEG